MSKKRAITDIKQLTPEHLTKTLKMKGKIRDGEVTKIKKKKSQQTTTSMVHFLELKISNEAQTKPTSLEIVVKVTNLPVWLKILGKLEVKFYSILAETMDKMPIPTCYEAVSDEEKGTSHKILEDLSLTHEGITHHLSAHLPPPKRYCEMAIDSLAELHAFWWDHQKLKEFSKFSHVLYTFKENSFNEKDMFTWFDDQKILLKQFMDLLGDRISGQTKEMFNTIFLKFPQLANERLKKENLTVIHGDAHLWQFFYPKDIDNENYKAILSDWQFWSIGVGCQDLAYMIGMFIFPENRNKMEEELIKRYHNNLVKFGVKNYSWDECWYDYRLFNLLNIYRNLWWWRIIDWPTLNNPFWWSQLNTAILTIEDLNCMELLEDK